MIIREIELENFGIYGGVWRFNLTPVPADGFNRPIVLFKGKNGAGKTSLTEAIRLCLHGSLAYGSRVGRAEYQAILAQRLHQADNRDRPAASARINLLLNYVDAGRLRTYRVERHWTNDRGKIKESVGLHDLEDPIAFVDFKTDEERESFLRELMPPRVADLFFFDGEKLELLSSDKAAASLLRDTVEALFGLNLVKQLQDDLDVYLTRQTIDDNARSLQQELATLRQQRESLENERTVLTNDQKVVQEKLVQARRLMHDQEQKIASEGGWFAERLNESRETKQRLEAEIDLLRKQAQELANGLMPFAIAPQLMGQVAQRLQLEQEYEQAVSAQQVLTQKFAQISSELAQPDFWSELEIGLTIADRQKLLAKLETTLQKNAQPPTIDPAEIMLRLSEQDRRTLHTWIDRAADEVPRDFCRVIFRLNRLEDELKAIEREMMLAPAGETLSPLIDSYRHFSREVGGLEKTDLDLDEQRQAFNHRLGLLESQMDKIRQQLEKFEQHHQRLHLAIKSRQALESYLQRLRLEKVKLLEKGLFRRFNQLCRKEDLVSQVLIDPETFEITLLRRGQTFERQQLSAGEKQLLATATIWALREVSRAPLPVILDTPLGRLDSDHRASMLDYFAQASHQVILLATDTEIDRALEERLQPAISHTYDLDQLHHHLPQTETPVVYTNGRDYHQLPLVREKFDSPGRDESK